MSQAEWLAQAEAMKMAVSRLAREKGKSVEQPQDCDEDWGDQDDDYSFSSGSGRRPHDVWDFISDTDLDELGLDSDSGDPRDDPDGPPGSAARGMQWLATGCARVMSAKSGLDVDALQTQIAELLASTRSEDELQASLSDLIGLDDLEFVIDVLAHRAEIVASVKAGRSDEVGTFADQASGVRLLTKAQRDAALRKRDQEHKNAPLAAARLKEETYPHVYRAYNPGNTLSHTGQIRAAGRERAEAARNVRGVCDSGRTDRHPGAWARTSRHRRDGWSLPKDVQRLQGTQPHAEPRLPGGIPHEREHADMCSYRRRA